MTKIVTLSRPLPLPRIEAGGEAVEFVRVSSVADIPTEALAHISTAMDPVDGEFIAGMPEGQRLIANIGVGVDNIDLTAAAARGIAVSNTPVVTEDTADLAFALILGAARRVGEGERYLRAGKWSAGEAPPALGTRVHGQALGLVGFGPIAQAVARRARGFGMKVHYWNRTRREEAEAALGATFVPDLAELLGQSDFVSVHTALVPATRNLINADRIGQMRKGVVLVNTARGGIVDEEALCNALEAGHLGAAGLDVFADEPQVLPALLERQDVLLTPHIGSATSACRMDMAQCVLGNVVSFLESGTVLTPVETG
ncbi:glyoxylate reductase [Lutimaribacter pacificus]|uniref:Glyoxylate reductase n=1 Tax=Lutimaribacter pacificus TaxID=391948 RepID=A0A1H0ICV0_9RHOB|nr:D-glycerate dehydrogenase [Lutimaribacter pacificus]SDO29267.1 glyoxylate reductase [Lutimaribacter pacificus]SHK23396.1 glyoxylate reductase [Lutimaribacter pacificus]